MRASTRGLNSLFVTLQAKVLTLFEKKCGKQEIDSHMNKKFDSFTERIDYEKNLRIQIISAKDEEGSPFFVYFLAQNPQADRVEEMTKTGSVRLEDYGIVVYKGVGEYPSEEEHETVMEILRREYFKEDLATDHNDIDANEDI